MPDVKISALPASTTPLAGTEVLPIVQSATTRQVSVANLTAGRSVGGTNFIPSGSAAPTNGMYLPAANSLGFSTNSTEQMRITSAGNVGIGYTTPEALSALVVKDKGNTGTIALLSSTESNTLYIKNNGTSINFNYNDAYPIIFTNAGGERMRLDSSGNLLINTTTNTNSAKLKSKVSAGAVGFEVTDEASSDFVVIPAVSASVCKIGPTAGALAIQTAGTERMRIDSSGNVLVGTTSTNETSGTGGRFGADGYVRSTRAAATDASSTLDVYSTGASAFRFYVGMGGTVFATSIVISAISDQRLKENIRDIDTGISTIMALKPRRFDWKEGKGQDKKNVAGFIAQEFEDVFPECVSTAKAGKDGIEYKNINHETLIPTLVKAIQDQQLLIESLTTRLTALESK